MKKDNPDQSQLTTRYTKAALQFIENNSHKSFFLYLAHSMPHVPLFVSDKFKGKSAQGLYGDVIIELDWSVGQIFKKLKALGLDEDTMVMFTSDNGPWLTYGNHAGSAKPLREGKGTSFDGGQREPFIIRWPGRVPAGSVCRELTSSMDILPTLVNLAGTEMPKRKIDGKDIRPLIFGEPGAKTPHEALYFYFNEELQAVRSGKWKLHLPHKYKTLIRAGKNGLPGEYDYDRKIGLALFDLENDIGEKQNVAEKFPDVVARLERAARVFGAELKRNIRPAGHLVDLRR